MSVSRSQELGYVIQHVQATMPQLPYHNFPHARLVANNAAVIARREAVPAHEMHLLELAAWMHDIVYKPGALDNEWLSANEAARLMQSFGRSDYETGIVRRLILDTQPDAQPSSFLGGILRDADMWNLGTSEFLTDSELIRTELNQALDRKWYSGLDSMLAKQRYHTDTARRELAQGLENNRELVKYLLVRSAGGTVEPFLGNKVRRNKPVPV